MIGPGPIIILGLKRFQVWIGPGPILILNLKRFKIWNGPGPIIILDLRRFKVLIGLEEVQSMYWAWLIVTIGPDPFSFKGLAQYLNLARPKPFLHLVKPNMMIGPGPSCVLGQAPSIL